MAYIQVVASYSQKKKKKKVVDQLKKPQHPLQSAIHRKHIPQFRCFRLQAIKAHGTRHPPTPISKLCSVEIHHTQAKHEILIACVRR